MSGKPRTTTRKIAQRFELSEREHAMLRAIAEVNEESYVEVFRRILRDEYRYLRDAGHIKGDPAAKIAAVRRGRTQR